jgi:hypothetical protein
MINPALQPEIPRSIAYDLKAFPCLSKGNDSNVYRLGDQVAKEYQKLPFADVARYTSLQNEAVEALLRNPYQTEITIKGVRYAISASQVVPVDELALSSSALPLTLSRFIEAPNLEKLLWRPDMFEKYVQRELSDPLLITFASEMNAFFWNEYPTRAQDEFHYHTCMLSRFFDRVLGVFGCYISKYNIKLQPVPVESRINLIITDLALYIDRVVYEPRKE